MTVGITVDRGPVDHHCMNKSIKSLVLNLAHLEKYKLKHIVFPKKRLSNVKNGKSWVTLAYLLLQNFQVLS